MLADVRGTTLPPYKTQQIESILSYESHNKNNKMIIVFVPHMDIGMYEFHNPIKGYACL